MAVPGTSVTLVDEVLSRFPASSPSTWFVVGFTKRGPNSPVTIRGMDEFVRYFGPIATYSNLYDSLDLFFRIGGAQAIVQRQLGPTPVYATADIFDQAGSAGGDRSIIATAKEYGDWANGLNVEAIYSAPNVSFIVSHDDDGVLEASPSFATRTAAVAWASDYVLLTAGASNEQPRSQTVSLSTGADDHASSTTTQFDAALALLTRDYGAGLISAPGQTTDAVHLALLDHAVTHHRTALLDSIDSAVVADLTSDAQTCRDDTDARAGGLFAPWVIAPATAVGTTRTIPPSSLIAGLIAQNDGNGESINQAAAGRWGQTDEITDVTQTFAAADQSTLHDEGVNLIKVIRGNPTVYDYRTLVDPDARPNWVELSGARTAEVIANQADEILERFVFAQLDGRGLTISKAAGAVAALCQSYYDQGALFGETPGDAFFVDTSVNTPETIAARQLLIKVELATSPYAERIELTISKTVN